MESLAVRDLTFYYPERAEKTLDGLTFSVSRGEFVVLAGPTGCGKSTLLRQFKTSLAPHGMISGDILFEGRPLKEVDRREQSARIGFIMQNPDNQIVTDKVWHELAFGLESLGYDTPTIRGRVAEMTSFFGIQTWFYKSVSELSGGQKQLLNLASVMALQPSVLILDEPTSQLDPIAASNFLAAIGRLNRELGTTVIITEHRLEEVLPLSDRVLVMEGGRLVCEGAPREVGAILKGAGHGMFLAMPAPLRIYAAVPSELDCPVTVREGRLWLEGFAESRGLISGENAGPAEEESRAAETPVMELEELWFRYDEGLPDVIKGLSLRAYRGEFIAVLGGNGAGKTTALSLMSGLNRPSRGRVRIEGREISEYGTELFDGLLGVLPQNPQTLFAKKTVREDLSEMLRKSGLTRDERLKKIAWVSRLCRLESLLERHPYDLSGGEQQRAALAKVLLLRPRLLLMDEPTKGLDAEFKRIFAEILERLLRGGVTVVMVSHDIEFCAEHASRCVLLFDGAAAADEKPASFFRGNGFYTTAANRMARRLLPDAVTAEAVIRACGGSLPEAPELPPEDGLYPTPEAPARDERKPARLPLWRRILAYVMGAIAALDAAASLTDLGLPWLAAGNGAGAYAILILALLLLTLLVNRRDGRPIKNEQLPRDKRRLSKRTALAALLILVAVPLTIYVGIYYLGDRKYYFISLLILLEIMLPFVMIFEGRKPQARELIVISVLCAIGVAGRAAFFMLPQFKPVAAITMISGVAFGGETGFLVGAATMLASNVMFGQGPWTPWQMFAMGLLGFLAGVLFRKGLLRRGRLPLCVFGGLATVVVYGGLMNPSFVIMYQQNPTWPMFLTAYIQGFPFDLIHASATVIFLWHMSAPMLEKLDRIKVKYGLIE